jgi:hypothetical protein
MRNVLILLLLVLSSQALAALPEGFQSWTAAQKQAFLWNERILPSKYETLPKITALRCGQILSTLKAIATLDKSFDIASDELIEGRVKIVHGYGSAVQVEFQADPTSPYTGLYQGALGIARLSLAAPPSKDSFVPGMAVKFFADGLPSANVHVMQSVDGQGSNKNVLAFPFTNRVPDAKGFATKTISKWFARFSPAFDLGVDHLSFANADGSPVTSPVFPFQIYFVPTPRAQALLDAKTENDFRNELEKIPANTVLYEVWARSDAYAGGLSTIIGALTTRSEFVASKYGDEKLGFQHRRPNQLRR